MQKKLLIFVVVVLVLIAALFFVWQKKQAEIKQTNKLASQSSSENQPQSVILNEPTKKDKITLAPQHIVAIPGSDSVWYEIPELGVRVKLNKKYAEDLIYRPVRLNNASGEEWDVAYFSTKTMTRIDPYCSPENVGSIGALSKNKGIAKELAKKDAYIASRLSSVVQIENFYYMFETPQAACWDSSFTEEVLKLDPNVMYEGKGIKFLIEGYKDLQLIPEKE